MLRRGRDGFLSLTRRAGPAEPSQLIVIAQISGNMPSFSEPFEHNFRALNEIDQWLQLPSRYHGLSAFLEIAVNSVPWCG
jgi:hypothetical protein